jgi:acyl-coenzyme A thioesterase PaaI-like protein
MAENPVLEPAHFFHQLGLTWARRDNAIVGSAAVSPYLCVPRTAVPRASMLATFADITAGMDASSILRTFPPTLDLSVHVFRAPTATDITMETGVLKAGRRVVVGETWFSARGEGDPFAVAITTFIQTGPRLDISDPMPTDQDSPFFPHVPLEAPIDERARMTVVGPGIVAIDLRPDVSNGTTLQGGMVALLAERACESALADAPAPHLVTGLDLRYLAGSQTGPIRAEARVLRSDATGAQLWVEVRDADDRLLVHVVATTRELPTFVADPVLLESRAGSAQPRFGSTSSA